MTSGDKRPRHALFLPHTILNDLIIHAQNELPMEACGMLAGRDGQVERIYEMANADQASDHYLMVPNEQFRVVKDMRAAGLQMLAIYHSHPETPARPSQEDIRLALTPGVIYLIISLAEEEPVTKGFSINNGHTTEVPLRIVNSPGRIHHYEG